MTTTESVSADSPTVALRPSTAQGKIRVPRYLLYNLRGEEIHCCYSSSHLPRYIAAAKNVYSTRRSKSFKTILYTSFGRSKWTSEWNLAYKCRQQDCLLYVNKQLWLLCAKHPGRYGLYRLHTRVFTLINGGCQRTTGTGDMEIYQRIPGPAIRRSQDGVAGPSWRSGAERRVKGGGCG